MKLFYFFRWIIVISIFGVVKSEAQEIFNPKTKQLYFIENKGQWDKDIFFLCHLKGIEAWITRSGVEFVFYSDRRREKELTSTSEMTILSSDDPFLIHRTFFTVEGYNPDCQAVGKNKLPFYHNYFIGSDSSKWKSKVGLYEEVLIREVYSGIDLRYYVENESLRYDFIVHPYADPEKIKFSFSDKEIAHASSDDICIHIPGGTLTMCDLQTYQDNQKVESFFQTNGKHYSFFVGQYDRSKPLIIDPVILVTTAGGSGYDEVKDIIVDKFGNMYITGITNSMDYPVSQSAYQKVNRGSKDIFITKLDKDGQLIFSTYLGGSNDEEPCSINLDNNGNVFVAGETGSADFNITSHALQTQFGGGKDVFVAKLNADGIRLFFATYLGGSQDDFACDMETDEQGNTYITGGTRSGNFPVTPKAYQKIHKGAIDAFVTKINPEGTRLIYSTFAGGENAEIAYGITIDKSKCVYLTGYTSSPNYPVTSGAYQSKKRGSDQVFVTKFNSEGTSLVFSTLLGGSRFDYGRDIAVDSTQQVYVLGETTSFDFPVTAEAYQKSHGGGTEDVFIARFDSKGKKLLSSTHLGGSQQDRARTITLDRQGNVYVSGTTMSENFPTTSSSLQPSHQGINDAFLTIFSPCLSKVLYSTYIGSPEDDEAGGMTVDKNNIIYLTGHSNSIEHLLKLQEKTKERNGGYDVFLIKMTP